MPLNPKDLLLFAQAVDSGSFAAAARALGMPKSTVSKRVGELEAALGVRLVHRTTRRFVLTDVGREVYEHARGALIEIQSAEEVVQRRMAEPSGTVRLTASLPTTQFDLAPLLPMLARQYPKLHLALHATDRFVDVVEEGFDLALRSHFAPLPDSSLIQRALRGQPILLVAAPDYLARRGRPDRPEDLAAHDGLLVAPAATTWRLARAGRTAGARTPGERTPAERMEQTEVRPRGVFTADESVTLLLAAESGLGIVPLPERLCRRSLDAGRLERVLPGWTAGTVSTTLLTPHRRSQLPSVRAVAAFLVEHLG